MIEIIIGLSYKWQLRISKGNEPAFADSFSHMFKLLSLSELCSYPLSPLKLCSYLLSPSELHSHLHLKLLLIRPVFLVLQHLLVVRQSPLDKRCPL